MIRSSLFVAILASATLCAPPVRAADTRLLTRPFNADEVVRIDGRAGVQATISFGDDEHIENVAIGDSNSWQVTPNKRANLLFVKPLNAKARTNMTVVTDRHSYYFDLVASPAANALYLLRFTYPDEPKKDPATLAAAGLNAGDRQAIGGPASTELPRPLNFAWKQKGSARLLPARIYDDGFSTFVSWAPGTPLPAVLIRNERGAEGPVNFSVRNDVMIIDGVPSVIVLRSGRHVATLEYARPLTAPVPAPVPSNPANFPERAVATAAPAPASQGK